MSAVRRKRPSAILGQTDAYWRKQTSLVVSSGVVEINIVGCKSARDLLPLRGSLAVTRYAVLSHFEASKKPNLHLIHNESQHNGSRENAGDNRNRKRRH